MTSYNESEYLPQAIDSILSQTFQDIEIVIGYDGSDDGSIELIKRYCNYSGYMSGYKLAYPDGTEQVCCSEYCYPGSIFWSGVYISFQAVFSAETFAIKATY